MAQITVTPSRGLVTVELNVWEVANSGNTSTNKSTVQYSVVIKRGNKTWDTSWASWGQKIYASINIDYFGAKTIYIPTYNYGGTCPPGSVISSGSMEIEHDSAGNRTINFSLSFTDNADGNNNGSYYTPGDASTVYGSLALANIPRYFTSTPSLTFKDKTETQIRYNWSTSQDCDNITVSGSGTKSITGVPGKSGVITITGLSANTSYSHTGTFRRKDSQLTSNSSQQTNSTYNYPYIEKVSNTNVEIGSNVTITVYNPLGRSCTAYCKQNSTSGTTLGSVSGFTAGSGGYILELNATTMYNSIPNSQEGNCVYYIVSSSPSHTSGTVSGKYKIKGTETPTFTDSCIINVVDTLHANDITGLNTKIIKGHNTITGSITKMTAKNGANGSKYTVTANATPSSQDINYDNGNTKSFSFQNITTNSFTITAYDTRGLYTPRTKTIDLIDYSIPKINEFVVTRLNGLGEYIDIQAKGTLTYWSGWTGIKKYNTVQKVYIRWKKSTDSSYSMSWKDITGLLTINSNGNWELNGTLEDTFSVTNKFDFQMYIHDVLEDSTQASNVLSTANGFLWRDLSNKRLGINKKPERTLDVNGDIGCDALYINGNKIIWYE